MTKQIEEIANDLRKSEFWYFDDTDCDFELDRKKTAENLYNAGYRKQSEGEWKKRGNEKTCSLCKFIYYSNNDDWNFCPNCGARMSGGKSD